MQTAHLCEWLLCYHLSVQILLTAPSVPQFLLWKRRDIKAEMRRCRGKMMGFHLSLSDRVCARKQAALTNLFASGATTQSHRAAVFLYPWILTDFVTCPPFSFTSEVLSASTLVYIKCKRKVLLPDWRKMSDLFWDLCICLYALFLLSFVFSAHFRRRLRITTGLVGSISDWYRSLTDVFSFVRNF